MGVRSTPIFYKAFTISTVVRINLHGGAYSGIFFGWVGGVANLGALCGVCLYLLCMVCGYALLFWYEFIFC